MERHEFVETIQYGIKTLRETFRELSSDMFSNFSLLILKPEQDDDKGLVAKMIPLPKRMRDKLVNTGACRSVTYNNREMHFTQAEVLQTSYKAIAKAADDVSFAMYRVLKEIGEEEHPKLVREIINKSLTLFDDFMDRFENELAKLLDRADEINKKGGATEATLDHLSVIPPHHLN
jgi:hypothetical protein